MFLVASGGMPISDVVPTPRMAVVHVNGYPCVRDDYRDVAASVGYSRTWATPSATVTPTGKLADGLGVDDAIDDTRRERLPSYGENQAHPYGWPA